MSQSKRVRAPMVPDAPRSIQKGVPLKLLIDESAIECLALNIFYDYRQFKVDDFCKTAQQGLQSLSLMERGRHVAMALRTYLPTNYSKAVTILMNSLTPEGAYSEEFGLAGFFYLPHGFFISEFGLDKSHNDGEDPFEVSMDAMFKLTKRFTAEFAIRDFIIQQPERTLSYLEKWLDDECPHVRRLCSEGTRPKLPWGKRLQCFVQDPEPTIPFLNALKNDESLYVRRSVANHLGDIAKDHPELVFSLCEGWLKQGVSSEVKWVIRHALRHPAKKKNQRALDLRIAAKG
ncbi:DNA alkylation repair protein [Vibrio sp. 99-8-1]|uniref:DNA alkylation repair protein n=1 Tax=Vibrio sp. 99-8-1 TaxID=2607602 RepID=UPI0014934F9A|nr:DNA alkylation repair protein [Vibrio sp. 99-8-1]